MEDFMKKNLLKKIMSLTSVIELLFFSIVFAVPMTTSYQGFLLDNNGSPINGNVTITFNLYATEVDNQSLWTEIHEDIMVSDGIFNVILGTESAITNDLFSKDLYLGIRIDNGSELSPRKRLTSTIYALRAAVAESVDGINITDHSIDITKLSFSDQEGNIEITGNISANSFIGDGSQLTGIVKKETDPVWTTESSKYWTKEDLNRKSAREYSGAFNIGVFDSFLNSNSSNVQDVLDDLDVAISNQTSEITSFQDSMEQTISSKLDEIPDFTWEEVTTNNVDFDTQCEYRWNLTSGQYADYVFVATWISKEFLCCDYSVNNKHCIFKSNVKESIESVYGPYPARVYKRCSKYNHK
jgi:hypothetical protein